METFLAWVAMRLRESSTWVGLGIIAVTFGSDPMQAATLVQAMSLVLGGGLVAIGPVPGGRGSEGQGPAGREAE